jgi:hypothetical protein
MTTECGTTEVFPVQVRAGSTYEKSGITPEAVPFSLPCLPVVEEKASEVQLYRVFEKRTREIAFLTHVRCRWIARNSLGDIERIEVGTGGRAVSVGGDGIEMNVVQICTIWRPLIGETLEYSNTDCDIAGGASEHEVSNNAIGGCDGVI